MAISGMTGVDLNKIETTAVSRVVGVLSKAAEKLTPQVEGVSVKLSAIGDVKGAISGVQSKAADLLQDSIASDPVAAAAAVQSLATALSTQNSVINYHLTKSADDSSAGTLAGTAAISKANQSIQSAFSGGGLAGQIFFQKAGLSVDANGALQFDQAAYSSALLSDPVQAKSALAAIGTSFSQAAQQALSEDGALAALESSKALQYSSLVNKQNDLYERINNLQSSGSGAGNLQDYSVIAAQTTSAAKRITTMQTQRENLQQQIVSAQNKSAAYAEVSGVIASVRDSAAQVAQGVFADETDARNQVESVLNSLNSLTGTVRGYATPADVNGNPAGALFSDRVVTKEVKGILAKVTGSSGLFSADMGVRQDTAGSFYLDAAAFSSAYSSMGSLFTSNIVSWGAGISDTATTSLQEKASLNSVYTRLNASVESMTTRLNRVGDNLASLLQDPFAGLGAPSYKSTALL